MISHITAVIETEYSSEFECTKDTPSLALRGELWGAFVAIVGKVTAL